MCWLLAAVTNLALTAALSGGCTEHPVVQLGYGPDADTASDEDGSVEEQYRESLFRELAEKECRENEPVCGTDGKTYRNYCAALGSGVDVAQFGPC